MSCVPAVLVAFSVLPRRQSRQLIAAVIPYTVAIAVISRATDVTGIGSRVTHTEFYVSLVVVLPGLVALIGMIGWQSQKVLAERATELSGSRQRLVLADKEERLRVDREIREGVQAAVHEALRHLDDASRQIRDTDAADGALLAATERIDAAIADLRRVVTLLRPAALSDHGLAGTLPSTLHLTAPQGAGGVAIHLDGVRRYPDAIEGATWFACVEAVTALRHLDPCTTPSLRVLDHGEALHFAAVLPHRDDHGLDWRVVQSIDDRLAALDGFALSRSDNVNVVIEGVIPLLGPANSDWPGSFE